MIVLGIIPTVRPGEPDAHISREGMEHSWGWWGSRIPYKVHIILGRIARIVCHRQPNHISAICISTDGGIFR